MFCFSMFNKCPKAHIIWYDPTNIMTNLIKKIIINFFLIELNLKDTNEMSNRTKWL
jgi:hypothetical protein